MIDFLVDTNIIIYLFKQDPKYINFFDKSPGVKFAISIITYIELLLGPENNLELLAYLEYSSKFIILPLEQKAAFQSAICLKKFIKKSIKNPQFADIVIASTALINNVPLITNNPKDFRIFKGLKLIVP